MIMAEDKHKVNLFGAIDKGKAFNKKFSRQRSPMKARKEIEP